MSTQAPIASNEASLQLKLVGEITGEFVVARYQRGYRWGTTEVECLLNDIYSSVGSPYSLQPIVVKPLEKNKWELVDGQQRLTTLYLIFRYMKLSGLKPNIDISYRIIYDTRIDSVARPGSAAYLETLDQSLSDKNIDFFHMYQAYTCIDDWFARHSANQRQVVADDIFGAFMKNVRVIWYEANGVDATELFTRLNVGRIPLTDAELFKALLLSHTSEIHSVASRPTEIAAQWDAIERDLRTPAVWAFVSNKPADTQPTRITLLLEALTETTTGKYPGQFETFYALQKRVQTSGSAQKVWNEVLSLHALVMGWFENRDLYHKIGYLVAVDQQLTTLIKSAQSVTKRRFEQKLNDLIRDALDLTPSEAANLSYEVASHAHKAERLLLLMNVESVRRNQHSNEKYPFQAHKARAWSLEHIHAQNAQVLNKADQWRAWLKLHREALNSIQPSESDRKIIKQEILDEINSLPEEIQGITFNHIAARISEFFTPPDQSTGNMMHSLHSISNLALLSSDNNSALSNAVFEVKRQKIINLDRQGAYIPVCTRQVFLKYFTNADAQQIHFWSLQDRESYLNAMIGPPDSSGGVEGIVYGYLRPEESVT